MDEELEEDRDDFISRARYSLLSLMESDGWMLFKRRLLIEKNDQIAKMLSLLPVEANLPAYATARARISLIAEILSMSPADIAEFLHSERQSNA